MCAGVNDSVPSGRICFQCTVIVKLFSYPRLINNEVSLTPPVVLTKHQFHKGTDSMLHENSASRGEIKY